MKSFQDGYVSCASDSYTYSACSPDLEQLINNIQKVLNKYKPFDQIKMIEELSEIAFKQAKAYQGNVALFGSYCRDLQSLLHTRNNLLPESDR